MWKLVVIGAVAAGCSSNTEPKRDESPAPAPVSAPQIESAEVLAADDGLPPPVVVLIDDAGAIQVAAAGSWREIATRDLRSGGRPVTLEVAARVLAEQVAQHRSPKEIVAAIAKAPATLPPPDAAPAEADDGSEESGGTGRLVNLDEEERRQVKKHMGAALIMAHSVGPRGPRELAPAYDEEPTRQATIVGEVATDGRFVEAPRSVILAAPRAPARALIRTVSAIDGVIAVLHRGEVRPLRISFSPDPGRARPSGWIEARVSARAVQLEAVPGVPHPVPAQGSPRMHEAMTAALEAARASGKLDRLAPIDVLVEPDVDVQRLIDVIVALDLAGARLIGLGEAPAAGSPELARRGEQGPRVIFGMVNSQGDLPKAVIRDHVRARRAEILACYEAALARAPGRSGTVSNMFFIAPSGKVASASASATGLDVPLATCVASAIKSIQFPPPKGGGGVQVNLPVILRH